MNGIDIFADTNILIYAMEGHRTIEGILHCSPGISVISEIELLGKKNISRQEENLLRELLNGFEIVKFSDRIKEITISLKQKYTIKTPDAIIAATAKAFNLPLVTADKDFKRIKDIEVVLLDLNT
ncbi:MAG: type II toxin-antitoxin system VapC family toxin [Tannerella sp.]|nr:type II toxin-antitoxin system VapC family toxin [Tannerella sp.]